MVERFSLTRTGPDGDVLYPVDGTVTIGSAADCEVGVKEAAPRQCQIVRSPEGYVLHDLTGVKVTRVNGARIERHRLRPGDRVEVGKSQFRWTLTEEPEEELVLVVAAPPVRRRGPTAPIPVIAAPARSRGMWIGGAAAAVILLVLVVVLGSSPSQEGSSARRDTRPARAESRPSSPGALPEEVPTRAPQPRPESSAPATPVQPAADPTPVVLAASKPALPETAPLPKAPEAKTEPRLRTPFELRYAALLAGLDRTLARGSGYEQMYKEILECSTAGAPKGAADHLKALAASLKDAIACRECVGGKVSCEKCGGKGRIDVDCTVCQGQGRVRASGAVGDADVTQRCRNCEGKKVFKGMTCPACSRSGKTTCAACRGKVWPGDGCPRPECNAGRTPCPTCGGKTFVIEKCPFCVNGRVKAPGAASGADVTMKCRNCEIDGQTGTGIFKVDCKTCGKTGKVTCTHCGGAFNHSKPADGGNRAVETGVKAATPTANVYTQERCGECLGVGCDRCFGFGSRIRPLSTPARVVD